MLSTYPTFTTFHTFGLLEMPSVTTTGCLQETQMV